MNRKTRIASTLALVGFLCMSASPLASAAGPLLSGYGGPGGGEQAILGSTLIGGSSGGNGSGGSSRSGGSGDSSGLVGSHEENPGGSGGNSGGTASNGPASNGSGRGPAGAVGSSGGTAVSSDKAAGNEGGASHVRANASPRPRTAGPVAYVYPSSLRLASADSSALAVSGGDLLVLIATIACLALVGVLTTRLVRLQR